MALSFLLHTSVITRLNRPEVRSVVQPLAAVGELGRPSICDQMDGQTGGVLLDEAANCGALGGVESGREGDQELVAGLERGSSRHGLVGCTRGRREVARGFEHGGQVVTDFSEAAAGEQGDPGSRGIKVISRSELLARDRG